MPRAPTRTPLEAISRYHADLVAIRHDLHAHPELGFEEVRTAGVIARTLELLGIETHTGIGTTGVVGVIRGVRNASGRSVGLRADMDALPIREANEFAHRSTQVGRMHACGHDGHTTMLLGAARYLAASRQFDGTVNVIFQPAEEGLGGAKAMIDDGLFERFPCDSIYAMHNWPSLPPGQIGLNPGPMMAAADRFEIIITGRGGHAAHPYLAIDPVVVAGHLITAVQTIVARNVSPMDPAVLSICAMQAGDLHAMNVIPGEVTLTGTVRTLSHDTQALVQGRLEALVHSVAGAFGATARLNYRRLYPPTVNSAPHAHFAASVADGLVGVANVVRDLEPSMGAEDFSFMLRERPGAYMRLGQGGAETGCFLHNSRYDFNDAVLPLGSSLLAALAEQSLPLDPAAQPRDTLSNRPGAPNE
jgi:amidohydrolase